MVIFLSKYSQKTLNNLPMRKQYEILFVSPNSDWYGVPVIIMLHLMTFKIRLCVAHSYHFFHAALQLTHWGRATHICVGKLTTIGSDNGLLPGRRQAIIWTIAGILLIGPLGTNFGEILIQIQTFSFNKMQLKMSSAKWHPFVSASMC